MYICIYVSRINLPFDRFRSKIINYLVRDELNVNLTSITKSLAEFYWFWQENFRNLFRSIIGKAMAPQNLAMKRFLFSWVHFGLLLLCCTFNRSPDRINKCIYTYTYKPIVPLNLLNDFKTIDGKKKDFCIGGFKRSLLRSSLAKKKKNYVY